MPKRRTCFQWPRNEPGSLIHPVWIGSPNFNLNRVLPRPECVVIHTMGGSLEGTDSWFRNPVSEVSAHYGVALDPGQDGGVHQYVRLQDTAWCNGIVEAGNHWVGSLWAPNADTVGIETEDNGSGATKVTDFMYEAVRAIIRDYAAPTYPSLYWLTSHHTISPRSRANCAGARWVTSGRLAQLAQDTHLHLAV
jgi:N-acetylmuramoyl-L-alanine amidase